jgi:hypothetical protein
MWFAQIRSVSVSEGVQLLTVVVAVVIPHTGKSSRGGARLLWSQQCGLCSLKVALVVRSVCQSVAAGVTVWHVLQ